MRGGSEAEEEERKVLAGEVATARAWSGSDDRQDGVEERCGGWIAGALAE